MTAHTSASAPPGSDNAVLGAIDRAASAVAGAVATRLAGSSWASAEAGYRQLLEALGVAVYTTDADGRVTYFNEAAIAFWGRRPEPGDLWCGSHRLYWPDGAPMAHAESPLATALLEGRELRGIEAVAERPDGTRVAFTPYPTVFRDPDGTVVGAVNVLVDISDRKQAEDALRATAEALRTSNAVKDEFLGLVSHELRTPVTTIFGNARLLRDRGARLALNDRETMIEDIAGEAERLLGVVENLLLLTRLESGVHPDPEPQVLAHVTRLVVDSFQRRNPSREIRITSEPRDLIVDADRPYLDLLLENLLGNAMKYSASDQPIEVVVRASDTEGHVVVLDRGIGLDPADSDRLFTAFYRSEAARAQSAGLGIGLAACKRVVESLGGRLWASPRDGGGSEFGFALPRS